MTLPDSFAEALRPVIREELARALARPAAVELLTTDQAAEVAGVHPATLRRWVKEGRLRARHRGRSLRIERGDLTRAMAGETQAAAELLDTLPSSR